MNELRIFESEQFGPIRTMLINNEPWFAATDVCKSLEIGNTPQAVKKLDDDEKHTTIILNDSAATGKSQMTFVNEPGLYTLVLGSRKEKAKDFKRWITHEVVPSIRKHGAYATSATIDKIIADPEYGIQLLQALKTERDKNRQLADKVETQNRQIETMKPKATYYDIVLSCKDAVPISQISKDYGMSAQRLNIYLHKRGVQYKRGKIWLLYQKHADKGYTKTQTKLYTGKDGIVHPYIHTCWTQKGRMLIYNLLKEDGVLPTVEREVYSY